MENNEKDSGLADTVKNNNDDKTTLSHSNNEDTTCTECGNHPCVVLDMEEMLISILQTYEGWKSKKQIRFRMYSDAIKVLHGPGLGKGVRKKLPSCLQRRVHCLVPDEMYTGFKQCKKD